MHTFDTVEDQGLLSWLLKKIVDQLPAVLVSRAIDSIDALTDPRTPAVKRAILITALLELLGLIRISRPLAIILRFTIIQSAFVAAEKFGPPAPTAAIVPGHPQPAVSPTS